MLVEWRRSYNGEPLSNLAFRTLYFAAHDAWSWGPDTECGDKTCQNPYGPHGKCLPTAFAVKNIIGGTVLETHVGNETHFYTDLEIQGKNTSFDLTREQFSKGTNIPVGFETNLKPDLATGLKIQLMTERMLAWLITLPDSADLKLLSGVAQPGSLLSQIIFL